MYIVFACTVKRPPVEDILSFLESEDWIVQNMFAGLDLAEVAHGLAGKSFTSSHQSHAQLKLSSSLYLLTAALGDTQLFFVLSPIQQQIYLFQLTECRRLQPLVSVSASSANRHLT